MAAPTLEAIKDAGVEDPELLAGILSDTDVLALLDEAEKADEPGMKALGLDAQGRPLKNAKDVIFRGDGEVPAAIMAVAMKSAGYAAVYDRFTGQKSIVNKNNLPQVLKKQDEHGRRVFTLRQPKGADGKPLAPAKPTVLCLLHPKRRTPEMDAMGLPVCTRPGGLTNELQVRLHMQHRHKSAWEAIEEAKKLAKEARQEARDEALLALAQQQAPKGGKG